LVFTDEDFTGNDLGLDNMATASNYGARLVCLCVIRNVPEDELVIIFVQINHLLPVASNALKAANIDLSSLVLWIAWSSLTRISPGTILDWTIWPLHPIMCESELQEKEDVTVLKTCGHALCKSCIAAAITQTHNGSPPGVRRIGVPGQSRGLASREK
jgi:hypothetical protein